MPLTPQIWLDSQTVNTTLTGDQSRPDIAQLANGNILVTWTTDHITGDGVPAGTEVFAQLYDPLGTPIGSEFRINQASTVDNERDSDIVALPDGGFLVIYHDSDFNDLGGSNIRLERFDATGAGLTENPLIVLDVGADTFPNYANPRGAASSATSVMVIYDKIEAGISGVFFKIYNPTADTYSDEAALLTGGTTQSGDVAVLSNGNYVAVAARIDGDSALTYRILNTTGTSVLGATFVDATNTNTETDLDPSVTALAGGGFVIAWTNTDAVDTDVNYRIYNATGGQTGSGILTFSSATNNNNEPAVAGLADGSFIIAYDNDEADTGTAAHISAAGLVLGEFQFTGTATQFAITSLADGRFAVTYQSSGDIHMEILDTRDNANAVGVYDGSAWQVGTIGNDVFTAFEAATNVHGYTGNDTITDGDRSNTVFGDAGNDTILITSEIGSDGWFGGIGTDTIDWSASLQNNGVYNLTLGTATDGGFTEIMQGFENFTGTANMDMIIGTTAANILTGGIGNDTVNGDAGADTLFGSAGDDSLIGGSGNDILSGGSGIDSIEGGIGNDQLIGGNSGDTYIVDAAGDIIVEVAGQGFDRVLARVSYVLAADDDIETLQTISTGSTTAINLTGNALSQGLFGNAGANTLDGAGGADTLRGHNGNDTLIVRNAATILIEGLGEGTADRVLAAVSFNLAADDDIETLQTISSGSTAALNLTGNALSQSLFGNAGANQLDGREGQDTLTGAGGADRFVFATAIAPTNVDRITDFAHAVDKILLEGGFFTGIGNGGLLDSQFHAGASGQATSSTERIIYETDTGHLWYDADGSNTAIARVLFGTLTNVATGLTASDFIVF